MNTQWIPEIGDRFLVASPTGFSLVYTCTKRSKVKEQVYVFDENDERHRLEDCEPLEDDRPLNDSEIEILKAYVEQAIAEMLPEILDDALSTLAPHHKQQLWAALSDKQRRNLAIVRQLHQTPDEEDAA